MQSSPTIEQWNEQFAIPGIAKIVTGQGGLPKVGVTTPEACADIYLHGAHLTSWIPVGFGEVVFLSKQSRWEEGRAIRGGIPVCFPWFRAKVDNPQAPAHGVVRTTAWQLESLTQSVDSVIVTLVRESDDVTRRRWPYEFRVVHRLSVGAELKLELTVTNLGSSLMRFEEALHTYHRVGDAREVEIAGLAGTAYLDNIDGNREKRQRGNVLLGGQTDNAYLDTESALEVIDPVLQRRVRIEKGNSRTTVVWNPWDAGAASMADLGSDEWREFACVEASNILSAAVELSPGAEHTMSALIRVFRLQ